MTCDVKVVAWFIRWWDLYYHPEGSGPPLPQIHTLCYFFAIFSDFVLSLLFPMTGHNLSFSLVWKKISICWYLLAIVLRVHLDSYESLFCFSILYQIWYWLLSDDDQTKYFRSSDALSYGAVRKQFGDLNWGNIYLDRLSVPKITFFLLLVLLQRFLC